MLCLRHSVSQRVGGSWLLGWGLILALMMKDSHDNDGTDNDGNDNDDDNNDDHIDEQALKLQNDYTL